MPIQSSNTARKSAFPTVQSTGMSRQNIAQIVQKGKEAVISSGYDSVPSSGKPRLGLFSRTYTLGEAQVSISYDETNGKSGYQQGEELSFSVQGKLPGSQYESVEMNAHIDKYGKPRVTNLIGADGTGKTFAYPDGKDITGIAAVVADKARQWQ